ncbi:hypothetical protein QJS10_CPB18g00340 [Acorus calamus]|uniref:Uncharacterized protein n=1 Tax=Acorus calamus TaxID=4465 RepID=A0AAV9CL99_ACOCL|nr:hypothetical protein QJS10_CPB18g00340 [Acorus calamus]
MIQQNNSMIWSNLLKSLIETNHQSEQSHIHHTRAKIQERRLHRKLKPYMSAKHSEYNVGSPTDPTYVFNVLPISYKR